MDKWEIISGKIPVLLVAGHNAEQIREEKIKERDWGTGNMVKYLCEKTGAYGMYTTQIQSDSNFYEDAPFRQEVLKTIKDQNIRLVLDIHGRRAGYPLLIEFILNKHFEINLLENGDAYTQAEKKNQKLLVKAIEVPAVEVEIRRDGRTWGDPNFEVVIKKLERLIKVVKLL